MGRFTLAKIVAPPPDVPVVADLLSVHCDLGVTTLYEVLSVAHKTVFLIFFQLRCRILLAVVDGSSLVSVVPPRAAVSSCLIPCV